MSKDKTVTHVDRLLASRDIMKDKEAIESNQDIAQITSEQQSAVDFANAANEQRSLRKGGGGGGGSFSRPRGGGHHSGGAFSKCSNTTDASTGEITEKCSTNLAAVGGVVAAAGAVAGIAAVAKYCYDKHNNGQQR